MARFIRMFTGCTVAGLMLACTGAYAQERSASGAVIEKQMSWTALKTLVDNAKERTEDMNRKVDAMVLCNNKFKLYAPTVAGHDSGGCIENALIKQLANRMDTAETGIQAANTQITALSASFTKNITRIDASISTLTSKMTALTTRITGVENDVKALSTRMASLESQVVAVNERILNIQTSLNNQENRLGSVENRIGSSESRLNNSETRLSRAESQISSLNAQIVSLNAEIASMKTQVNDLYNKTDDLYDKADLLSSRDTALEATANAIRTCGGQMKLTNSANQCVDLPFQKETQYVETPGWISSPLDLVCTAGRKISFAMVNVSTRSNQLACGRSGANCDGNATSSLLGLTHWYIDPDPGKVISAYIECK